MKKICGFLILSCVLIFGFTGNAIALIYTEDFEAPFPTWESGWLGVNSNLQNYYGIGGGRGNNPDGLWLDDGDGIYGSDVVDIIFAPSFGNTLTNFAIDIAGYYGPTRLQIFDMANSMLLDTDITLTQGACTDPGTYAHYSVGSSNGISKFSLLPGSNQIEGNTSIDNVMVDTTVIPEPATLSLLSLGLLGFGAARRKNRRGI